MPSPTPPSRPTQPARLDRVAARDEPAARALVERRGASDEELEIGGRRRASEDPFV